MSNGVILANVSTLNLLSQFPNSESYGGGPAFHIAIYVLISIFILVGIVYMFSKLLMNHKLSEWARDEFIQCVINATLVGGLVLLMAPVVGLIPAAFDSVLPSGSSFGTTCAPISDLSGTPLCFAYDYENYLSGLTISALQQAITLYFPIDMFSKLGVDLIVVSINPLSGLTAVETVISSCIQSLTILYVIENVQMTVIQFIGQTSLQIFLPIGLVLRCFFGTRRIGGALMALAIGSYLIYPLFISLGSVVGAQVTSNSIAPLYSISNSLNNLMPNNTFISTSDYTDPAAWSAYGTNITSNLSLIASTTTTIPNILLSFISIIAVQILVLPLISLILTGLAIKELASGLGSELDLTRLGLG